MKPLQTYTILNTRPQQQASALTRALEQQGARLIELPCIEITDPTDPQKAINQLSAEQQYDYAIFVSANAVSFAKTHWQNHCKIIAIGNGTATALETAGFTVDIIPSHFSSEALLDLTELKQPKSKKIIIFCGEEGRKLLANRLTERDALVTECFCYARRRAHFHSATELPLLLQSSIDIIISTSADNLINLYQMLGNEGREWLLSKQLLVISPAMQALAHELGFAKAAFVAKNASTAAIVEALIFSAKPR